MTVWWRPKTEQKKKVIVDSPADSTWDDYVALQLRHGHQSNAINYFNGFSTQQWRSASETEYEVALRNSVRCATVC